MKAQHGKRSYSERRNLKTTKECCRYMYKSGSKKGGLEEFKISLSFCIKLSICYIQSFFNSLLHYAENEMCIYFYIY